MEQKYVVLKNKIEEIAIVYSIPTLFLSSISVYYFSLRLSLYFVIETIVFFIVSFKMLINYKKYLNVVTIIFLISMIETFIISIIFNGLHKSNFFERELIRSLNSHMLFFIGYYIMSEHSDKTEKIANRLSIIIFASVIYAYIDFFTKGIGWRYASQGFFDNPIPASTIWLMGLWLPIYVKSKKIDMILKIFYIPPIIFSTEKNAWLGLIVIICVAFIKYRTDILYNFKKIKKNLWGLSFVGIVVLCVIFRNQMYEMYLHRVKNLFQLKGVHQRIVYWEYTLEQIKKGTITQLLFGRGWDSSNYMLKESTVYTEGYPMCDNSYLTSLYEFGLLRIILVIAIFVLVLTVLKKYKNSMFSMALMACFVPAFFYDANLCVTPMVLISTFIGFVCAQYIELKNN